MAKRESSRDMAKVFADMKSGKLGARVNVPTVKDVRVASNANKAKAAVVPPRAKGKPGESNMSRSEATGRPSRMGGMDTGNVMKSKASAPARTNRQGGMDSGNVMKAKTQASSSKAPTYSRQATPGSNAEAYRTARTNPVAVATGSTRRELSQMVDTVSSLSGIGMVKKLTARVGTAILKRASKTQAGQQATKLLEGPLKRLTGPKPATRQMKGPEDRKLLTGPKPKAPKIPKVPSRPFPKGKGTYKGKRTPGTYIFSSGGGD
jgi:hypothetical protein